MTLKYNREMIEIKNNKTDDRISRYKIVYHYAQVKYRLHNRMCSFIVFFKNACTDIVTRSSDS